MTALDLLAELERSEVEVTVQNDDLHLRAPKGVLTEARCALLKQHKPALLRLLTEGRNAVHFWRQVEDRRTTLGEWTERSDALRDAWGEELEADPNYPDAPLEQA